MARLFYISDNNDYTLYKGDCLSLLPQIDKEYNMIFADPPYFLSNGGISVQSGKIVCVNKGEWDKAKSEEEIDDFNHQWLTLCRERLSKSGSIWITGTYHNIFSVAKNLNRLGYKILNVITWVKTNPPPNISCRYFTYSTEFVIWARKDKKEPHYFNYKLMRQINDNKQMTDVWKFSAIAKWEKIHGKHPTQKPLALLTRIILASTHSGDLILDPFCGSCTTGIAANLLHRKFIGIDQSLDYLKIGRKRRLDLNNESQCNEIMSRIKDLSIISTSESRRSDAERSAHIPTDV